MSQANMFQTPDDVARELAQEIRELKDVLREISRKVGQIETRVKRVFSSAFPAAPTDSGRKQAAKPDEEPTLSPEGALQVYDELVGLAKAGSRDQVQQRLESFGLPDLALLCRELGVSLRKKKPSRTALVNGVLGRVSESVMLSSSNLRERSAKSSIDPSEANAGSVETKEVKTPEESGS